MVKVQWDCDALTTARKAINGMKGQPGLKNYS